MKNKIFLILMSTILTTTVLAGCSNKPTEQPPSASYPVETVEQPVEEPTDSIECKTLAIQTSMCKANADYVIKSQEEFDDFIALYEYDDVRICDSEEFTNTFDLYKGYFIDNTLLVHVELASSGSDTYEITSINLDDSENPYIVVNKTTPEGAIGTCDMATWFFFAEIPNQN